MTLIKRIIRSDGLRTVLCWLGAQYIRFVYYSSSWKTVNREIPEAFWAQQKPFILCMWHNRFLIMPYAWPVGDRKVQMLISRHRDGQIISKTIGHLGIGTIAGSTKKGGTEALRAMLAVLKKGEYVGMTPDGPRGPRMRASNGVVALARLSGLPVIPIAMNTSRRKVLSSWDHFVLAWPFSKGVFMWGEPVSVERDADAAAQERFRCLIETALTDLSQQADRYFGHPPVEPAPPEFVEFVEDAESVAGRVREEAP